MNNIETQLTQLRLHGIKSSWQALTETKRLGELSLPEGLEMLLQAEIQDRENRRFDRLRKAAMFRYYLKDDNNTITMFDRFVLASNYNRIQSRYDMASLQEGETYIPSFNIVPDSVAYVIIPEHNIQPSLLPFSPSMQSYFEEKKPNISIRSFMFGLQGVERDTKYFIRAEGDRNINNDPNYTGSKAIFLQPKYKRIIREQRCLVLADAFIIGIEKPYLVYMRGKQRPFTFAGVWNKTADDKGPEINTFAIITIVANPLIRKLGHDRMPVILRQPDERRWLYNSTSLWQILEMLSPYPAYLMNAYPISEKIKDRDDLSVIQPTGRPVLYEGFGSISGDRVRKVKDYSNSPTMAEAAGKIRK